MSEPDLDGAQVSTGFEKMGGTAVAERVGVDGFVDAGGLGSLATSQPHDIGRDGSVGALAFQGTREEVGLGLHPTPVLAQSFQQLGTERNIAVTATLALGNANHHALAINVADLETAQLGPPQGGKI